MSAPPVPTFNDWVSGLGNIPDEARSALAEKYFNENIAPKALTQGLGLDTLRKQWMDMSQRPEKSATPRLDLVGSQAMSEMASPFAPPGSKLQQAIETPAVEAAKEAEKQGINPEPYQFIGSNLGQAPYWAVGMGAAEKIPIEVGKRIIRSAAGGIIQGSYDLLKTGNVIEGLKGAGMGAGMTAGAQAVGGLWKYLTSKGVEPEAAKAVEQVAKGTASEGDWEKAVDTTASHDHLDVDINDWVTQQVKAAKAAGVPEKMTPKEGIKGLQISMTGADGKNYSFVSPTDADAMISRINDHLQAGGSIQEVAGTPKALSQFYKKLGMSNPESFNLTVPIKGIDGKLSNIELPLDNDEIAPPKQPEEAKPAEGEEAPEEKAQAAFRFSIPLSDQLETLGSGQIRNKSNGNIYDTLQHAINDIPQEERAESPELVRGSSDVPLSPRGEQEVDFLGQRMAAKGGLDKLVIGSLTRTQQTGHALLKHSPTTQVLDVTDQMQSWASGELEGKLHTPEVQKYKDDLAEIWPDHKIGGMGLGSTRPGESFNDVKGRVIPYFSQVRDFWMQNPDQKIGVVTHFTPMKVIDGWLKAGMPEDGSIDMDTYLRERAAPAGVYRVAPNEDGEWRMRKVNIVNDQELQPGIYLIRHGETPFNKGSDLMNGIMEGSSGPLQYKETPLSHRFLGSIPEEVKPNGSDKATGVTMDAGPNQKPSIVYNNTDPENIFHENIHGHLGYLDVRHVVAAHTDDALVHDIHNNLFAPNEELRKVYGQPDAEEIYAYTASAIRTGNKELLGHFADADTDLDHLMEWTSNVTNDLLEAVAEKGDSIHKRTFERRLNSVLNRSTRMLDDVDRAYTSSPLSLDLDRDLYAVREGDASEFFSSRDKAISYMESQYQEPIQAPELVPTFNIPEGVPRYAMKVPAPSDKLPISSLPLTDESATNPSPAPGTSVFSFFVRPFADWLSTFSHKMGVPELYQAFDAADKGFIESNNAVRPFYTALRDSLHKYEPQRRSDFLRYMQAEDPHKDFVAKELGLSDSELADIQKYKTDIWDKHPELQDYIQKDMLSLRDKNPKQLPLQLAGGDDIRDMIKSGDLDIKDTDLLRISALYARKKAFDAHIEPHLERAEDIIAMHKDEFGVINPLLKRRIAMFRGQPDITQQAMEEIAHGVREMINRGVDKVNAHLPEGMQLGKWAEEASARDLLSKYLTFSYASAIGAKPGTMIRNTLQFWTASYPLLGNYITDGLKASFDAAKHGVDGDSWQVAQKYGAVIERWNLKSMFEGGQEDIPGVGGQLEKVAQGALRLTQISHNASRLVTFWGHVAKVGDATEQFLRDGDLEQWTRKSDAWFMNEGMRNKYVEELKKLSDDPTDFNRRMASDLTTLSQWNLRPGASPGMYQWQLGRLFGQFGSWPLNYIEYANRFLKGSDPVAKVQALTRLVLAHGSVLAAGASVGIDTSGWVFFEPMKYGGGPALQMLQSAPSLLSHGQEGQEARREFKDEFIFPGFIPGGEEMHQVWKAVASDDPNLWIHMMGFKPEEVHKR